MSRLTLVLNNHQSPLMEGEGMTAAALQVTLGACPADGEVLICIDGKNYMPVNRDRVHVDGNKIILGLYTPPTTTTKRYQRGKA